MPFSDDVLQMKRTKHLYEMEHRSEQLQAEENRQLQLQQHEQDAPLVRDMETEAHIEHAAPPVTERLGYWERKKQEERRQADAKAEKQEKAVRRQEGKMLEQRRMLTESMEMNPEQIRDEKELLAEKLKAITLREGASLLAVGISEVQKREVRWKAQAERAEAAGQYARMLPLGSKERIEAMAVKEAQEIKADKLRRLFRVTQLPTKEERKREEATIARHEKYDVLKATFRRDNPLSHEDAVWKHPVNGHELINVGRAFMGGTKPMYIFEDRQSPVIRDGRIAGYKQYLFKEAVNCVGFYKPEGALVTEAAAKLQDILCGRYSIPAFSATDSQGRVLGSFQERIDIMQEGRVDLFAWQAKPRDNLTDQMKSEILREHALDWLLCNFDTKGENFLHRTDGHLSSFDKEASFGRLKDAGAAKMSTDYCPHANDTLYNTFFTEFAQGRLTLDLSATLEQIKRMEAMSREDYLGLFTKMLDQKYGSAGPKNKSRNKAEEAIYARKANLREEYRRFYTELIQRRHKALRVKGEKEDCTAYLNSEKQFQFDDEPDET